MDLVSRAQQYSALDGVVQFANISGPSVLQERLHRRSVKVTDTLPIAARVLPQEVRDKLVQAATDFDKIFAKEFASGNVPESAFNEARSVRREKNCSCRRRHSVRLRQSNVAGSISKISSSIGHSEYAPVGGGQ